MKKCQQLASQSRDQSFPQTTVEVVTIPGQENSIVKPPPENEDDNWMEELVQSLETLTS